MVTRIASSAWRAQSRVWAALACEAKRARGGGWRMPSVVTVPSRSRLALRQPEAFVGDVNCRSAGSSMIRRNQMVFMTRWQVSMRPPCASAVPLAASTRCCRAALGAEGRARRASQARHQGAHGRASYHQHEGQRTQQRHPPHRGEGAAFGSVHQVPGGRAPEEGAGRGDRSSPPTSKRISSKTSRSHSSGMSLHWSRV